MLPTLSHIQELLVSETDAELTRWRRRPTQREKADGSLVTELDHSLQNRLARALQAHWPDIALLGEEMDAARQQALLAGDAAPLWCLDPLDGTTNFAAGAPFFCVSLALLHEGRAQCGLVYDPLRGECFAAGRGQGARLNDVTLRPPPAPDDLAGCLANVDFKRLSPDLAVRLARQPPYRSQRNFGSCALEWAWLAAGRIHIYLHGGMKLWDHAAGALILAEAGGHGCTLEGRGVTPDSGAARSVVAAGDARLFHAWCQWLGVTPDD